MGDVVSRRPTDPRRPAAWTGEAVRALRAARRMTVRQFADHLGVSSRTISKWERKTSVVVTPRAGNQSALDVSLARCTPVEVALFWELFAVNCCPTCGAPRRAAT